MYITYKEYAETNSAPIMNWTLFRHWWDEGLYNVCFHPTEKEMSTVRVNISNRFRGVRPGAVASDVELHQNLVNEAMYGRRVYTSSLKRAQSAWKK